MRFYELISMEEAKHDSGYIRNMFTAEKIARLNYTIESINDGFMDCDKYINDLRADVDTYMGVSNIAKNISVESINDTNIKMLNIVLENIYKRNEYNRNRGKRYYKKISPAGNISLEDDDDNEEKKERGFFGTIFYGIKRFFQWIVKNIIKFLKWLFGIKDEDVDNTKNKFKDIQNKQNNATGGNTNIDNSTTNNYYQQNNINNNPNTSSGSSNSSSGNPLYKATPIVQGKYIVNLNNKLHPLVLINSGRDLNINDGEKVDYGYLVEVYEKLATGYAEYSKTLDSGSLENAIKKCIELVDLCKRLAGQGLSADDVVTQSVSGNHQANGGMVNKAWTKIKNHFDKSRDYDKLFSMLESLAVTNNKGIDKCLKVIGNMTSCKFGRISKGKSKDITNIFDKTKVLKFDKIKTDANIAGQVQIGSGVKFTIDAKHIDNITSLDMIIEHREIAKELAGPIDKSTKDINKYLSDIKSIDGDAGKISSNILKEIAGVISVVINNYRILSTSLIGIPNQAMLHGLDQVANEILDQYAQLEK